MALLIFYVLLALGVSFLCSVLEAVLLSVSPSYVARMVDDDHPAGPLLDELRGEVDRPLAAILSLNTIAHTMGAAGAGAQAEAVWDSQAVGIFSAVLTLLILIFSEIIPKSLGAMYWRKLAPVSARFLRVLILGLYPLVRLSEMITSRLGGGGEHGGHGDKMSREEFAAMAKLGKEQGVLAESELQIVTNLFRFAQLRAHDIMTPRTVLFSLPVTTTVSEAMARPETTVFSRVPVWEENEDQVVGFVRKDEILLRMARDEGDAVLGDFKRSIPVIPATVSVANLFETLLGRREHIALLVDGWGGVEGVATMEDVVETLLGLEIVDDTDAVKDMREMARIKWKARAERMGIVAVEAETPED